MEEIRERCGCETKFLNDIAMPAYIVKEFIVSQHNWLFHLSTFHWTYTNCTFFSIMHEDNSFGRMLQLIVKCSLYFWSQERNFHFIVTFQTNPSLLRIWLDTKFTNDGYFIDSTRIQRLKLNLNLEYLEWNKRALKHIAQWFTSLLWEIDSYWFY